MQINTQKKQIIILFFIAFILILINLTSLYKKSITSKRQSIQSALLNPKYKDTVCKVQIKYSNENLTLKKYGNIWVIVSDNYGVIPVQLSTIKNFINTSTKVIKMYTKTDKINNWHSLNIDSTSGIELSFFGPDEENLSVLYFGIENSLTNRITVRSIAKNIVYETDNSISVFLNTDINFWCDPYIIPQCVVGLSDNEMSQQLRHGQLIPIEHKFSITEIIQKDFGNTAEAKLQIGNEVNYTNTSDSISVYTVHPEFIASKIYSEQDTKIIQMLNYSYSISAWTYNKLKNEK